MPELPEVETIARGLATRVSGDVIESVWLGDKPEPLKSSALDIAATLEHSMIATVRRAQRCARFRRRRNRASGSRFRALLRIVPRAQDSHQERPAESKTTAGSGKYLCR